MVKTYEEYYHDVKVDGDNLQFVPTEMRSYTLCLVAIENDPNALAYVPRTMNGVEYSTLCKIAACGKSEEYYSSWGVKVGRNAWSGLNHVPIEMRTFDLCLEAVKKCGNSAFKYVPDELKNREMYFEALKNSDYFGLKHIPVELRDREICFEAVKKYGSDLEYVPEEHKDEEMCLVAVKNKAWGYSVYQHFPEKYRSFGYWLYAEYGFDCLIKSKND